MFVSTLNQGDCVMNFEKYLFLFCFGGLGYGLIEIAFRGYTHWSMIITGGSAFLCLYIINKSFESTSIYKKALVGALIITTLELTVGLVVNKTFNLAVWDYTNTPINFLGIISLPFCFCWYIISLVVLTMFSTINKITSTQKFYKPLHHVMELQQK
ncbi:MAG: hypothetical protein E7528_03540 [Ruminococcaceae bacterium]|nr:hypothetical protein [Oscillospiraceae bacterium]